MAEVTTTDAEEMKDLLRAHPSLRAFPGIRATDVLARCRGGCRKWLLARGTGDRRKNVPECVAGSPGGDPHCAGCLTVTPSMFTATP